MNTSGPAAYAMYPRTVALPQVVGALHSAGFQKEDICMVLSPAHPDAAAVGDATALQPGDSSAGPGARMIGWFSGFGAVVIPTVGLFIRSQAFFQALLNQENLPALSRSSGALLGLGFPPDDAKRLGQQLSDVGALVYVACKEKAIATGAIELLRGLGAREAASLEAAKTAHLAA